MYEIMYVHVGFLLSFRGLGFSFPGHWCSAACNHDGPNSTASSDAASCCRYGHSRTNSDLGNETWIFVPRMIIVNSR